MSGKDLRRDPTGLDVVGRAAQQRAVQRRPERLARRGLPPEAGGLPHLSRR